MLLSAFVCGKMATRMKGSTLRPTEREQVPVEAMPLPGPAALHTTLETTRMYPAVAPAALVAL